MRNLRTYSHECGTTATMSLSNYSYLLTGLQRHTTVVYLEVEESLTLVAFTTGWRPWFTIVAARFTCPQLALYNDHFLLQ
jgi:hypothetical protein